MIVVATLFLSFLAGVIYPVAVYPQLSQETQPVVLSVPALLAIAFALAFITESTVEYMFGKPFDEFTKLTPYKWTLMYLSLLVGVLLSFFYRLDLIAAIAAIIGEYMPSTWVGYLLTGLGVGRGANHLHDFVTAYVVKPAARA